MLLFLAADTFHEELDEDVEMFKEGEGRREPDSALELHHQKVHLVFPDLNGVLLHHVEHMTAIHTHTHTHTHTHFLLRCRKKQPTEAGSIGNHLELKYSPPNSLNIDITTSYAVFNL